MAEFNKADIRLLRQIVLRGSDGAYKENLATATTKRLLDAKLIRFAPKTYYMRVVATPLGRKVLAALNEGKETK